MGLQDAWKRIAYNPQGQPVKHVWDEYLAKEKTIYANLLRDKTSHIEGTVTELAENFHLTNVQMFAFLDGIHEAVDNLPELDEVEESTPIVIDIDFVRLYKQMVEYKADALYNLSEWDNIFTSEQQQQYYSEQKKSHTIVRKDAKIGRNDACHCGSGKKYKKCCAQ